MNITAEALAPVLREYDISGKIEQITYYYNETDDSRIKIIAKLDVEQRDPLVIKLLRDPSRTHAQLEKQYRFAEHLRRNGIPTPERYTVGGEFCLSRTVDGEKVDVVLEDWVGDSLTAIDHAAAGEIGSLLARIHRVSFRDNRRIGTVPRFNAVGDNDYNGFGEFEKLSDILQISRLPSIEHPAELCSRPALCRELVYIGGQKLDAARALWERLPNCAVQGDISLRSITRRQGGLYVFDFNNAGDETLMSDMILEGLLLTYGSPLAEGLTDADRPAIFTSFYNGYKKICPLTQDELYAAYEIYPFYSAFLRARVDRLRAAINSRDSASVDALLDETYALLTADARRVFSPELFA